MNYWSHNALNLSNSENENEVPLPAPDGVSLCAIRGHSATASWWHYPRRQRTNNSVAFTSTLPLLSQAHLEVNQPPSTRRLFTDGLPHQVFCL